MMCELESQVLSTIRSHRLFEAGDRVFVALSGGADSVALLHMLLHLKEELGLSQIAALHVHHGIRGASADRDEEFVKSLCSGLDIPLWVEHVDVPTEVTKTGESVEEAARRLRYAFFESHVSSDNRAKLATAHTADDQAETVLFHLVRGSGLKGLAGIPVMRGRIVRPLLDCRAQDVRGYCHTNDLLYQIDETNHDLTYARNRIRHEVLPSLRVVNAQATDAIVRFSKIAAEEDRFLDSLTQQLLQKAALNDHSWDCAVFLKENSVLVRRALVQVCEASYAHVCQVEAILRMGGSVNLPRDRQAVSDGRVLVIRTLKRTSQNVIDDHVTVCEPFRTVMFAGHPITPHLLTYDEYQEKSKIHKNLLDFCVSYDMIEADIVLRTRQAGDSIRPRGRGCTKSFKKLFNEMSIPVDARECLPILTVDNRVAAVLGICVDEAFAVTPQTNMVLWLEVNADN